jgi:uncharacterized membrane protein YdjX (TVP38/TMEM64 family)
LLRPLLPMIAVLLLPVVPFLLFGSRVEAWWRQWQQNPPAPAVVAAMAVGLLATDIFLPVPSSLVATFAGWELGVWRGTAVAWIGMSLGAIVGFALARRWGRPLVAWLTRPGDFERTAALVARYGPAILVLGRGVPVLAEASVLILGMHGLSWSRFLPGVLLSNLGLAIAYAALGRFSQQYQLLPLALGVSIALPVLLVAAFRGWSKM